MSKAADKIEKLLKEVFPTHRVKKEKYVFYSNTELKFDFFLPELKILIEVQGSQHFSFNKFFHGDKSSFQSQKYRDSLKTQWVSENGFKLVALTEDEIEELSNENFRKLIVENL